MKSKTKKKPTWQVLYEEICKHPQGILATELRKKLHDMNPQTFYRLLKKLKEKKLIIKPHRILVKPTSKGIKNYKQHST